MYCIPTNALFYIYRATIFYDGSEPQLYVLDVELIKRVMIKDFDHFTDFGFIDDRLSDQNDFGLANARGEEWKALKATISPAFSLKNLNTMAEDINKVRSSRQEPVKFLFFYFMLQVALSIVENLKSRPDQDAAIDAEQPIMVFAMDCIAKVVFSMDLHSTKNPDNEFLKKGKYFMVAWRFLLALMFPAISYWFNIKMFDPVSANYFEAVRDKHIIFITIRL